MKSDIEIAREAKLIDIYEIGEKLGINKEYIEPYGNYKGKIKEEFYKKVQNNKKGKLILVTAITPTPAGEGKSTVTIGLTEGMNRIGLKTACALREPSLGPVFGIKGGAAGGGYSQVLPMEEINLHFTGDLHAITAANNLLCALVDNHIEKGNDLEIDEREIFVRRVLDINDRTLRNVVVGLGGKNMGYPREDHFMITVASEVMAIFCLSKDLADLKKRLGEIIFAKKKDGSPLYVKDLGAQGAMTVLLKDAIKPNLVQTLENNPAIIHGGPFANIAHGCNSIRATKLGLSLNDYLVTEAGFGADLGGEKFMDIKCRIGDLHPDLSVLVITLRALKMHGNLQKDKLSEKNIEALREGFKNAKRHMENMLKFKVPLICAINVFEGDTEEEINELINLCKEEGIEARKTTGFMEGGKGAEDLAILVKETLEREESHYSPLYDVNLEIEEKIQKIAEEIYRARGVNYTAKAKKEIKYLKDHNLDKYPICMAKTQYSFSDDPKLLNAPENFEITVKDVRISNGAGFIVCETGDIMVMPGLSKHPAALDMDIDENGRISGLF